MDFRAPWKNSDLILLTEDVKLHVHKSILSFNSPVFDRMLNGDFIEAQKNEVLLHGKKITDIEEFLGVIYDRRHMVTLTTVNRLLQLADEYQVDCVQAACEAFLKQVIVNSNNVVVLLQAAYQGSFEWLKTECLSVASKLPLENDLDYQTLDDRIKCDILKARLKVVEEKWNVAEFWCYSLEEEIHDEKSSCIRLEKECKVMKEHVKQLKTKITLLVRNMMSANNESLSDEYTQCTLHKEVWRYDCKSCWSALNISSENIAVGIPFYEDVVKLYELKDKM